MGNIFTEWKINMNVIPLSPGLAGALSYAWMWKWRIQSSIRFRFIEAISETPGLNILRLEILKSITNSSSHSSFYAQKYKDMYEFPKESLYVMNV